MTGVVLDLAHDCTNIVPIYEGYIVHDGIVRYDIAGSHLTAYLETLFARSNIGINPITLQNMLSREKLIDIKEKLCFITADYEKDAKASTKELESTYQLPDGSVMSYFILYVTIFGNNTYVCA